jgi:3-hydroxyanthranilic acid dioxygenase
MPFNLRISAEIRAALLQPPICSRVIQQSDTLFTMLIGGPNARLDFHVNQTEVCTLSMS